MRRPALILAALALAVAGVPLVGTTPAYAHATMVATDPEEGAILDALPDQVSFEFSEPMDPVAYVVVTAPDGTSLADGDPVVDGSTVTQSITDSGDGTYLMAVKAVSEDGHPITGRVEFVVGEASEPLTAQGPGSGAPPTTSSPAATASSPSADAGSRAAMWAGQPLWVWSIGLGFLVVATLLWLTGRRTSDTGPRADPGRP